MSCCKAANVALENLYTDKVDSDGNDITEDSIKKHLGQVARVADALLQESSQASGWIRAQTLR